MYIQISLNLRAYYIASTYVSAAAPGRAVLVILLINSTRSRPQGNTYYYTYDPYVLPLVNRVVVVPTPALLLEYG